MRGSLSWSGGLRLLVSTPRCFCVWDFWVLSDAPVPMDLTSGCLSLSSYCVILITSSHFQPFGSWIHREKTHLLNSCLLTRHFSFTIRSTFPPLIIRKSCLPPRPHWLLQLSCHSYSCACVLVGEPTLGLFGCGPSFFLQSVSLPLHYESSSCKFQYSTSRSPYPILKRLPQNLPTPVFPPIQNFHHPCTGNLQIALFPLVWGFQAKSPWWIL